MMKPFSLLELSLQLRLTSAAWERVRLPEAKVKRIQSQRRETRMTRFDRMGVNPLIKGVESDGKVTVVSELGIDFHARGKAAVFCMCSLNEMMWLSEFSH